MKSQLRFVTGFVMAGLLVFSSYYGWQHVAPSVNLVVVSGSERLTEKERQIVKREILDAFSDSNAFLLSLAIANTIEALGWTDDVRVWRAGDTLHVHVDRKTIVAALGPTEVLTDGGDVVSIPDEMVAARFPTLRNPEDAIRQSVETITMLRAIAQERGQFIAEIRLSNEGWLVTMDSGITGVIGQSDLSNRLQRFLQFSQQLVDSGETPARYHIDARYQNGIALSEQTQEPVEEAKELLAHQQ